MARPITNHPEDALHRAMDLFWSRGYRDVSVDDLVQLTGLNRHSLYAHYGSKFGLAREALRLYCDESARRLGTIFAETSSPTERLRQFMHLRAPDGTDSWWAKMLERGCFAVRMSTELRAESAEISSMVASGMSAILHRLADVIRAGQSVGQFRSDRKAEDLATMVYSAWLAALLLPPDAEVEGAVLSLLT